MAQAIRSFLDACGLDVEGTELEGTPENVARAFCESFIDGYDADPAEILSSAYAPKGVAGATEIVLVKDVPFHGMCPHHLLPFHGRAHVAYIPGQKLASLSSLARQEFLVGIGNPKAIVIFTAFFPQFVDPDRYLASFAVLGALFLVFEMCAVALYALAGRHLGRLANHPKAAQWLNRTSGSMMIGFGLLLAFARRPAV